MKVKIKKLHPNAVIPRYAKQGDAGMDLTAVEVVRESVKVHVKFGLAMEIPEGHVGLIFPRSSIHKTDLRLSNCVGVIDSGYRGEIMAVFDSDPTRRFLAGFSASDFKAGDRCAQIIIMPYPQVEFEEVEELSETERGTGGYGSSGR